MAEIRKSFSQYRQINSNLALYNLRMSNYSTYLTVMKLREEHECLMGLPIQRIIPLMKRAVETLIEDGYVKKCHTPEDMDLMAAERNKKSKVLKIIDYGKQPVDNPTEDAIGDNVFAGNEE